MWRSAVRVGPGGLVLEPVSGAFDVKVAPGEDLEAALGRCPHGGCVLMLPGTYEGLQLPGMHEGLLELQETFSRSSKGRKEEDERRRKENAVKDVHVFGRGRATLVGEGCPALALLSTGPGTSFDGLVLRRVGDHEGDAYVDDLTGPETLACVRITTNSRVQFCDINSELGDGVLVGDRVRSTIYACRWARGWEGGVLIHSVEQFPPLLPLRAARVVPAANVAWRGSLFFYSRAHACTPARTLACAHEESSCRLCVHPLVLSPPCSAGA